MQLSILLVVVLAVGLNVTGCSGLLTETPLNSAAEVGQKAIFKCTADVPTQQNWIFSAKREDIGTSAARDIVRLCAVQSAFMADYDVEKPGGSNYTCNLIIKAAAMQLAGVYTCSDSATGPSAILTVIDRDPSIAVSNRVGVVAGDRIAMSYTVRYRSSTASSETPTMQPLLTWTDSDGNIIPSSEIPGTNSVTSSISVTAERKDIRPYTSHIFYSINGSSTVFATNTPRNVSTPISTPAISVSYAPVIEFLLKSEQVPVCSGDTVTLTCEASANPPATYSWIHPENKAKIEVDMNGVYTCIASNFINGSIRLDSDDIEVNVFANRFNSCEMESGNDTKGGNSNSTVAIILGSLLALSVAVNIAVIVLLVRCKRSELKTGSKSTGSITGWRNSEEQVQNNRDETGMKPVYEDLSQTRDEQTIYTQLSS